MFDQLDPLSTSPTSAVSGPLSDLEEFPNKPKSSPNFYYSGLRPLYNGSLLPSRSSSLEYQSSIQGGGNGTTDSVLLRESSTYAMSLENEITAVGSDIGTGLDCKTCENQVPYNFVHEVANVSIIACSFKITFPFLCPALHV